MESDASIGNVHKVNPNFKKRISFLMIRRSLSKLFKYILLICVIYIAIQ